MTNLRKIIKNPLKSEDFCLFWTHTLLLYVELWKEKPYLLDINEKYTIIHFHSLIRFANYQLCKQVILSNSQYIQWD